MADRPRSLPAFAAQFPDDVACARWLFEKRWPDGFRCPGCGHDKGWELGRGLLLVECGQCHRQTSVTAGRTRSVPAMPSTVPLMTRTKAGTDRSGLPVGMPFKTSSWL